MNPHLDAAPISYTGRFIIKIRQSEHRDSLCRHRELFRKAGVHDETYGYAWLSGHIQCYEYFGFT